MHMHVCHVYSHTHLHMCVSIFTSTLHTHTCLYTHTHTHIYSCTWTPVHTHTRLPRTLCPVPVWTCGFQGQVPEELERPRPWPSFRCPSAQLPFPTVVAEVSTGQEPQAPPLDLVLESGLDRSIRVLQKHEGRPLQVVWGCRTHQLLGGCGQGLTWPWALGSKADA